jgi:hypothetical protein
MGTYSQKQGKVAVCPALSPTRYGSQDKTVKIKHNKETANMEGTMRVQVVNKFSPNYAKTGMADEKAWDRNDFWIPVLINGIRHLVAKMDLVEA